MMNMMVDGCMKEAILENRPVCRLSGRGKYQENIQREGEGTRKMYRGKGLFDSLNCTFTRLRQR